MKKILFYIALLISITCAMRNWQFNIGIRMYIFDLLQIIFLIGFVHYAISQNKIFKLSHNVIQLIRLLTIWLVIVLVGDFFSIIFPISDYSVLQSIKGILITILYFTFFIAFSIFYSDISNKKRVLLLNCFILGVAISVVYSFIQFYYLAILNINIDTIIWPAISYNHIVEENDYKFDMIYRLTGIVSDPNSQGLYILLVLPILFYKYFTYKGTRNFIIAFSFFIAFILTLSRSVILSFLIIFLIFILSQLKRISTNKIIFFLISLIPIFFLAYYFQEEIQIIMKSRNPFEDSNRSIIYKQAFNIFLENPLGIGYNNYSAYRLIMYGPNSEPNAHNSWLTILAEEGLHGLAFYLFYFFFLMKSTFRNTSEIAIPYRYSLFALIIAITFNQTLNLFYVQYFIVLFFLVIANNLSLNNNNINNNIIINI